MRRGAAAWAAAWAAASLSAMGESDAERSLALAEAALRDGLPSLAWNAATNALASIETTKEERAAALYFAGSALERLEPPQPRLDWIDSLSPSPAPPPALSWLRARALSALHRYAEAAGALSEIADAPQESLPPGVSPGDIARDLAHALSAAGRNAEAAVALERAMIGGGDPALALELSRLLAASGKTDEAAALLERIVADDAAPRPLRALATLRLGVIAGADREAAQRALEAFSALETGDPASAAPDPLPPELRTLALATRAALLADAAAPNPPPPESLAAARQAFEAAAPLSPDLNVECGSVLLRLLTATPRETADNAAEITELARSLVAEAPSNPGLAAAIRDAASAALSGGAPDLALALCDIGIATDIDAASESAAQSIRAAALSTLGRHSESAAAFARAAETAYAAGQEAAAHRALFGQASELFSSDRTDAAAATLKKLLSSQPAADIELSAKLLAAECTRRADAAAADAALLEIAKQHPDSPEAPEALFRAGDYEGAAAAATALGEEAAAAVQTAAALSQAQLLQSRGKNEEALEALIVAAGTPDGGDAAEQAAVLLPAAYLALGRNDEALGAWQVFTNKFPTSRWMPDAIFWRAARAFDDGDWTAAAAHFDDFAKRWPDGARAPHALHFRALALYRAGDDMAAAAAAAAFASRFPADPDLPAVRLIEGEALFRLLRFTEAEEAFERVSLHPAASDELVARALLRRADCIFAATTGTPSKAADALAAYRAVREARGAATAGIALEAAFKECRCLELLDRKAEAIERHWRDVMLPFERAPSAADAVWYSRSAIAVAEALRAEGRVGEARTVLRRLAAAGWPGADEAARRADAL